MLEKRLEGYQQQLGSCNAGLSPAGSDAMVLRVAPKFWVADKCLIIPDQGVLALSAVNHRGVCEQIACAAVVLLPRAGVVVEHCDLGLSQRVRGLKSVGHMVKTELDGHAFNAAENMLWARDWRHQQVQQILMPRVHDLILVGSKNSTRKLPAQTSLRHARCSCWQEIFVSMQLNTFEFISVIHFICN